MPNYSGTILVGGAAQTAAPAEPARVFLFVHNPSLAEDLWVNFLGTAILGGGAGTVRLLPGDSLNMTGPTTPTGAVSAVATTGGHAYVLDTTLSTALVASLHAGYPTGADMRAYLEQGQLGILLTAMGGSLDTLDLDEMARVGIEIFERETDRTMLATIDSVRRYDPAMYPKGMLDLKRDLAAVTSVLFQGQTLVTVQDYRLLPTDADQDGRPWTRLQLFIRWSRPLWWSLNDAVSITGKWGYSALGIPADAWDAMLLAGALWRLGHLYLLRTRGFRQWREADMMEDYGEKPFGSLFEMWNSQLRRVLQRYARATVGM